MNKTNHAAKDENAGNREDETVTLLDGTRIELMPTGNLALADGRKWLTRPNDRAIFATLLSLQRRAAACEEIDAETGLKGCPFCGSKDVDNVLHNGVSVEAAGSVWLGCDDCACEGPVGETEAEARELWNRRSGIGTRGQNRTPLDDDHELDDTATIWLNEDDSAEPAPAPTIEPVAGQGEANHA